MNSFPAQVIKLLLLTLFLISPMIIASYFFPAQSSTSTSVLITPIVFDIPQLQPKSPTESKFALLIAQNPNQKVLGVETVASSEEENDFQSPLSGAYTIAILGDSMIDVMQPDLPQLASALKKFYPQAQFQLLNYGVGASNIEYGLTRLNSGYTYLDQAFPSLLSQNPDIIIIESFAYNHWGNNQADLDRQWLTIAKIVETIKNQSSAKIVLGATVGPDETTLCDGIEGIQLTPDQKREKAETIRAYLENLVNFAQSQGYPLADAYHATLDSQGNGKSIYVNAGDHLHPSGPGGELFAQKIAEAIYKNNLL